MANVLTPKFRLSFPNLFKTKKNELSGKDEYSCMALFGKGADLTALKKAAQEAVIEKWGNDSKKYPANLRSPFRKMEEKQYENDSGQMVYPAGMEAGGFFMNLKSNQRPGIVNEKVEDIINESEIYAGCYARATVRAYAYDNKGNRGVAFGLQNIQKMGEGDALGSKTKPQDDFEAIAGAGASMTAEAASADSLFN